MIIPTWKLQLVIVALFVPVLNGLNYLAGWLTTNVVAREVIAVTSIVWLCGAAIGVIGFALWAEGKATRKS